jgi:hypothetical protein
VVPVLEVAESRTSGELRAESGEPESFGSPLSALRSSSLCFSAIGCYDFAMDTKAKKKVEVLNQRLQKLRQQLAGARKQQDEPDEVRRLEAEVAQVEADVKRLKDS